MNEHDSETIAGMLIERGYEQAGDRKDANIVIFNTSIKVITISIVSVFFPFNDLYKIVLI